jgi:hypothetical protein
LVTAAEVRENLLRNALASLPTGGKNYWVNWTGLFHKVRSGSWIQLVNATL